MSSHSRVSLQDYVKENRSKNGSTASLISSGSELATSFKSKFVNGFPFTRGAGGSDTEVNGELDGVSTTTPSSSTGSSRWSMLSGESAFGLSRTQRIIGFFFCMICALLCFGLASLYIPVLVLKSRKFAALNTLGSCFLIFSFALLWGPWAYLAHLFSKERLPVTASYFSTVVATLYTSLWLNSTVLTLVFAAAQCIALIWFVLSYVPGGETGLRLMTGVCSRFVRSQSSATKVLPM